MTSAAFLRRRAGKPATSSIACSAVWSLRIGRLCPLLATGVREIRVHAENEYRVFYVAKFAEAVYVLHAFVKKTQQTAKRDIDLAAERYRRLLAQHRR